MGLTVSSTGAGAASGRFDIRRPDGGLVIALAGNPNVGKSTVFNALTGMRQHTGNWPGKTVTNASGMCRSGGREHLLVDLPGAYSLLALSPEEEAARDFLCFGGSDAAVLVCDATCLERNMNLVLQALEITPSAAVCVNLIDEAKKKRIRVDTEKLSELLGVPVCSAAARSGRGLDAVIKAAEEAAAGGTHPYTVEYPAAIESAVRELMPCTERIYGGAVSPRWAALRLLEGDETTLAAMREASGTDERGDVELKSALKRAEETLERAGFSGLKFREAVVSAFFSASEDICSHCVTAAGGDDRQLRADRFLSRRGVGALLMLALLSVVFYITLKGANYPSVLLSKGLFSLGGALDGIMARAGAPGWLRSVLIDGVWKVLAWVVSVMLPPMAIFFPMFTLLEDLGYLPRVAFNLDSCFKRCGACGKQSLTMCMGFGCNAAGVVGCRIIESPRERLIAILTNSFVPCNGRLPRHKSNKNVPAALAAETFASTRLRSSVLRQGLFNELSDGVFRYIKRD